MIAVVATGLLAGSPEVVERAVAAPSPSATETETEIEIETETETETEIEIEIEIETPPPTPPLSPAEGPVDVAAPTRVEVPAVDLAVDVLPTAPDAGEIDPPTLDEAYWIEDYGIPGTGSDNTVYLTGHSFDSGPAAFNPLFDKDEQVARVAPGDEVVVTTSQGRLTYEIESTERYPKDELADVEEVWKIVPDRLVLITCFQRNDGGASQDNFVVFANLVSSEPVAATTALGETLPGDS